jgi:hypothetical protein
VPITSLWAVPRCKILIHTGSNDDDLDEGVQKVVKVLSPPFRVLFSHLSISQPNERSDQEGTGDIPDRPVRAGICTLLTLLHVDHLPA